MKASTLALLDAMTAETPALEGLKKEIGEAAELLIGCFSSGGRLYVCGCGGSAADSEHLAGELVKAFRLPRPLSEEEKARFLRLYPEDEALIVHTQGGLPAHSLVSACGALSAIGNDLGGEYVFSQQVAAYARSGNSRPVVNAAKMARFLGARAVALTGKGGGKLAEVCDILLAVPETETYRVQQLHMPLYHVLCAAVEEEFFGK